MPIDFYQLIGSLNALSARIAFHQRLGLVRTDWRTASEQLEIGDFVLIVEPKGPEFTARVSLPMSKHDSARVLHGRGVAQRFGTAADARRWCEAMFLHVFMAECTAMGLGWPSVTKDADDDEWARRHVAALLQCNSNELRGAGELVLRMISGDWSGIATMGREHFAGSSAEDPATDSEIDRMAERLARASRVEPTCERCGCRIDGEHWSDPTCNDTGTGVCLCAACAASGARPAAPDQTLPPREFAERWSAALMRMLRQRATPERLREIFGDDALEMPSVQAHLDELARRGTPLPPVSVTAVREGFDLFLREQVMAWAEPWGQDALELVSEVFSKSNVETMIKWIFEHEGDAEPKHTGADQ